MLRSRLVLALSLAAAAAFAAPAAAEVPSDRTLYDSGPDGRYLMDGAWQFRLNSQRTWSPIEVPYAWNATDPSVKSFVGTVGWYRKDFELPSADGGLTWIVRFESVNYRATVYLNGTEVAAHEGAYLPWEVKLPAHLLKRGGTNRLQVRVDSRRGEEDLPPMSYSSVRNEPTGGWWNYGGILREVYLRSVASTDLETVQVLPELPCRTCDATIRVRAVARNYDNLARRVRVSGTYGNVTFAAGAKTIAPGATMVFKASVPVVKPRLWSPEDPYLYDVELTTRVGGAVAQRWTTRSGVRSIENVGGRLYLNGLPLSWRGFGLHEDSLERGFALNDADRRAIVDYVTDTGGTLMRSHYPLHPQLMEIADEEGLLVWSEIPMYQVRTHVLERNRVRRKALGILEQNILANGNHPSVIVWSIANELNSEVTPAQHRYIRRAVRLSHRLDPTRPVGQAVASNLTLPCQKPFRLLDVYGLNEYFNWYTGADGTMAERENLGVFLRKVRRCYPEVAIAVTEFGAEANRDGPVEERGTYQFQEDFIRYHMDEFANHPWLSGITYWALMEFRVRPNWDGGNPRPQPPIHQKGIVTMDGFKKLGYYMIQRYFRAADQFPDG